VRDVVSASELHILALHIADHRLFLGAGTDNPTGHGPVVKYGISASPVRPMIMHGMRSGVPKPEQDRFLPLFHGEKEWKQTAGFTKEAGDQAYLLLVSSDGTVLWTNHGRYSEELYLEFKKHLL